MSSRWPADLAGTRYGSFSVIYPDAPGIGVIISAGSGYTSFNTNVGGTLSSAPAAINFNTTGFGSTDWAISFGATAVVNITATVNGSSYNTYAQFVGDGSSQHKQASLGLYGINGAIPALVGGRSAGDTSDFAAVDTGDVLFCVSANGTDGTAFDEGARVLFVATGRWTGTSHPTEIRFYTCPVGSTTKVLVCTIGADGNIVGTTATQSPGDNSTKLASTAYVDAARVAVFNCNETAHGFVVGTPVARTGGHYVAADITDPNKPCIGLVKAVIDANNFTLQTVGKLTLTTAQWDAIAGTSGGLTDSQWYALGGAGTITSTPTGSYQQVVLLALSTTDALIQIGDLVEVGGGQPFYSLTKVVGIDVASGATVITFSGIPAGYSNARIRMIGRCSGATNSNNVRIKINNDATAANYTSNIYIDGIGAAPPVNASNGTQASTTNGIKLSAFNGTAAAIVANRVTSVEVNLVGYSQTSFTKTVQSDSFIYGTFGVSGNLERFMSAGVYLSTSAINRIDLILDTDAYADGSRATLELT